jgi:hypothetical protein
LYNPPGRYTLTVFTRLLDNRQFKVMMAFTGLNVVVTIILAVVRKRLGMFGITPERKEGNEFIEAAKEKPRNDDGKMDQEKDPVIKSAVQITDAKQNSDTVTTVEPGNSKGIA